MADDEAAREIGLDVIRQHGGRLDARNQRFGVRGSIAARERVDPGQQPRFHETRRQIDRPGLFFSARLCILAVGCGACPESRSEEHTSELQSLMRISYAVFCLKKKITIPENQ